MEGSLYERLGGKSAVEAAVDLLYDKILADDRIRHFFDGLDVRRLRAKQKLFLTHAFGGPVEYSGRDLRAAHRPLALTQEHFAAVADLLAQTLDELDIAESLQKEVMEIVAEARSDVLCL